MYQTLEPYHKQALWAAEEIKKRTSGRYDIAVFPASSLGKVTANNLALSLGTVDIIYTGMAFAGRAHPPMPLPSAPFVRRDHAHWQAFRNGPIFKELAQGSGTWAKLSDAEQNIFDAVLWDASSRGSQEILDSEARLVGEFAKLGKPPSKVDRAIFGCDTPTPDSARRPLATRAV